MLLTKCDSAFMFQYPDVFLVSLSSIVSSSVLHKNSPGDYVYTRLMSPARHVRMITMEA